MVSATRITVPIEGLPPCVTFQHPTLGELVVDANSDDLLTRAVVNICQLDLQRQMKQYELKAINQEFEWIAIAERTEDVINSLAFGAKPMPEKSRADDATRRINTVCHEVAELSNIIEHLVVVLFLVNWFAGAGKLFDNMAMSFNVDEMLGDKYLMVDPSN